MARAARGEVAAAEGSAATSPAGASRRQATAAEGSAVASRLST